MFENASRKKFRFSSKRGELSVEDLWTLPLIELNEIAKGLYHELSQEEVTFLKPATKNNQETAQKFDLVKYIIGTRMKEMDEASQEAAIAQQRQQIMGLIAQKEMEALASKSVEELRGLLQQEECSS